MPCFSINEIDIHSIAAAHHAQAKPAAPVKPLGTSQPKTLQQASANATPSKHTPNQVYLIDHTLLHM
jgi:hypothetical protein